MNKLNNNITFKGKPVRVSGHVLKEGERLPSFRVVGNDLSDITNANFAGKTLVISAVPSIDTPVCSVETKRFNEEAGKAGPETAVLTVSMDLPFAQKRWCAAEGVANVTMASDYKYRSFGSSFGLYIEDLGLLARAVFVAGKDGKIEHIEYVNEIASEPDYSAVLKKIAELRG